MLPLFFPSSAAKASPAVTAASSLGTRNDSERICTIRPDVSLENPMLPVALKGEELSGLWLCPSFLSWGADKRGWAPVCCRAALSASGLCQEGDSSPSRKSPALLRAVVFLCGQ